MQATDFGNFHDPVRLGKLDGPAVRIAVALTTAPPSVWADTSSAGEAEGQAAGCKRGRGIIE